MGVAGHREGGWLCFWVARGKGKLWVPTGQVGFALRSSGRASVGSEAHMLALVPDIS